MWTLKGRPFPRHANFPCLLFRFPQRHAQALEDASRDTPPEDAEDTDPLLIHLQRELGRPVTRQEYIEYNYPDGIPDPWTAENEAELPEALQLNKAEDGD